MRNYLTITLFALTFFSLAAQEITYDYSEINQLAIEQGKGASLLSNGALISGRVITRYPNGSLRREEFFLNGERTATTKWWYADGLLGLEENYIKNKRHGLSRYWHNNGQLSGEVYYIDGEIARTPKYWDFRGNPIDKPLSL